MGQGGLVVSGGGSPEQFPVLKAFQEFIEAERAQARKRVFQLTLTFATVLIVIVAAFFAIGISMFNNMSEMQTRLLDAALRREAAAAARPPQVAAQPVVVQAPAPVAAQPAPIPDEVSRKLAELGSLAERLEKEKDSRLEEMRRQMEEMRRQNENLKNEMEKKNKVAVPGSGTEYTARGVGILKPASYYRKPAPAAPQPAPAPAPAPVVQSPAPAPAAPVQPKTEKSEKPAEKKVKQPIEESKVKPPAPPQGLYSTRINIEGRDGKKIPWSMMIPE